MQATVDQWISGAYRNSFAQLRAQGCRLKAPATTSQQDMGAPILMVLEKHIF